MSKNTLQEYCQRRSIPLPEYTTVMIGGSSHKPEFSSTVTIIDTDLHKITANGSVCSTKKSSECSAAEHLLVKLDQYREANKKIFNSVDEYIYVLVDLENIHMGDYFADKEFSDNYHFVGFATSHHPSLIVAPTELTIHTIDSTRRDASDIMLIGYASQLIQLDPMCTIIIVTKDHFGEGLVEYLRENEIDCYCVKTTESLTEVLLSF